VVPGDAQMKVANLEATTVAGATDVAFSSSSSGRPSDTPVHEQVHLEDTGLEIVSQLAFGPSEPGRFVAALQRRRVVDTALV